MARCLNCMKEYEGYSDVCPHCGFDKNTPPKEVYHLYPGTELMGRYIIGTVVGFGGFGIVYKAWDTMMKSVVAIKEYFPVVLAARSPKGKEVKSFDGKKEEYTYGKDRFLNEAKIMAKFNTQPNIVSIFDFFEENNTGYIVMEFLDGLSLKQYLLNEKKTMDIPTALSITESMCDILSVIHHAGIIHRDISPDNIFICLGGKIKLIDFGASRLPKVNPNLTKILKPGYAPPEQYSNEKIQGSWTDVYALGATLYRMLTGKVPEESTDRSVDDRLAKPSELNQDVPEYLDIVIMRAMTINPELRYQNMDEFKKALRNEKGVIDEKQELKRRKRSRRISMACVLMLFLAGILYFGYSYYNKSVLAKLPDAELVIWIPAQYDANSNVEEEINNTNTGDEMLTHSEKMEKVLEEFISNYGDHVKIRIDEIPWDEYEDRLSVVQGTEDMPTMFYVDYLTEKYQDELWDISGVAKKIKGNNYLFDQKVKDIINTYDMLPTGFNCYVLYENSNMSGEEDNTEISEEFVETILSNQKSKGEHNYYQSFLDGKQRFYVGSTANYYEIMGSYNISAYVTIHDISNVFEYGYLSDFWCISKYASDDEAICAKAIMSYLIKENCQRLFFTVASNRISESIPLNKEIFLTNYYKNSVSDKMNFIEDMVNCIDIIELPE